jgi:hypothetical protein
LFGPAYLQVVEGVVAGGEAVVLALEVGFD